MDKEQGPASSTPTLTALDGNNGDYKPGESDSGRERYTPSDVSQASARKGEQCGDDTGIAPTGEGLENLEKQPTTLSIHHPSSFPDGGATAWFSVLGGFAAMFCSFGGFCPPKELRGFRVLANRFVAFRLD